MIVGIYTNDFALLNKITNKINDSKIKLRHIENLPIKAKDIDVLITKKRIRQCKIPQIQPGNLDILELRIRCEIYDCKNIIIGIDPGGMTGLSVIGANRILFMDNYKSIEDLANIVKSMNGEIGISSIKIGLGSPPERTRIIDSLREFSGIIQLVDEHNSGSGSHTKAATRIALREGEINEDKTYDPKPGEVAWIQKQSRRKSKGLVTIDKELAHKILIGQITMRDAIKQYTKKMKL
tara:strand:- start:285 stop:995 length:711 start_codon:yes stop_codon:yes gene_type:complete